MHTNLVAAAGQAPARAGELVNVAVIVLDRRSLCGDEITGAAVAMQLPLTAEERTVLRGRRRTCCGRDVLLQLPRDGALHPGDCLTNGDASVLVEVTAACENLLRVHASSSVELLQASYHLGNRHVALELHEQELLLLQDPVLESMLRSRGLTVTPCHQPFVPEGGAYSGHAHG